MSYARFGWDGSDVYVYLDIGGYLNCCACWLNEPDEPWKEGDPLFPPNTHCSTTVEMVEHLLAHRAAGHSVPQDTLDDLLADADENDARIKELADAR